MSSPAIEITARPSQLDPDLCTFLVDRSVQAGGPFRYDDQEAAGGSPLPEALFAVEGVSGVVIQNESVIVRKNPELQWPDLMPAIGKKIREQVATGAPAILVGANDDTNPRSDAEMMVEIQRLLDEQINPALGHHGGSMKVHKVEKRVVHVSMQGGCQGCASASMTLRNGVEVMLRRAIPSIEAIVDATDHARGENPYY